MRNATLSRACGHWLASAFLLLAASLGTSLRTVAQQVAIQASQTVLCAGGTAILTASGGANGTSTVSYSWSPVQDLAPVSGSSKSVVVGPLTDRTYTVTATDAKGTKTTATVLVSVNQNCCQRDYAPAIVELDDEYGTIIGPPGPGCPIGCTITKPDPFRAYPAGTYFHVRSGGSLHLIGTSFRMPPGTVLMMDPGRQIIIDDATLDLEGATITATCNEMWGSLRLPNLSHGLTATASNLHTRIMHSLEGIVIEDMLGPGGPVQGQPTFQLDAIDFLHNYSSLTINRENGSAFATDRIRRCLFDSDPTQMKAPYNGTGASANYAQEHVRLTGNLASMKFMSNILRHAIIGVRLLAPPNTSITPAATLTSTQFSDFYLAGVFYADAAQAAPTPNRQLLADNCTFSFLPSTTTLATDQLTNTRNAYSAFFPAGVTGIATKFMTVDANQSVFEQANAMSYPSFSYGKYSPAQTGIAARHIRRLTGNTFRRLHAGVAHELQAGSTEAEVKGNLFVECSKGYEFVPSDANGPNIAGIAWLDCNTFARGVDKLTRPGTSFGIFCDATAYAKIDNPDPSITAGTTFLRNRFDDAGAGASQYQAIYNANSGYLLRYYTYYDIKPLYDPFVNAYVSISAPPTGQAGGASNPGNECAPDYPTGIGIARTAVSGTKENRPLQLAQNAPNPVNGVTTFQYQLPSAAQQAELLLRRATDGVEMGRLRLAPKATHYEADLRNYPAGVYFYTLVVEGVPTLTRRLIVQ
jgi:hypothetical protein